MQERILFPNGAKNIISMAGNKGGLKIEYEDNQDNKNEVFLLVNNMMFDKWWKVDLQINGSNTDPGRTFICEGNCEQDALDLVVDYAIENDIGFTHTDFYEAQDNNMVNEHGEVIDCVACGNTGIYVPSYGVHINRIC